MASAADDDRMLDEIIARARKHRPNLLVSLNGGPESFPNDIMQRVSYIYAEPLDCPTGLRWDPS